MQEKIKSPITNLVRLSQNTDIHPKEIITMTLVNSFVEEKKKGNLPKGIRLEGYLQEAFKNITEIGEFSDQSEFNVFGKEFNIITARNKE